MPETKGEPAYSVLEALAREQGFLQAEVIAQIAALPDTQIPGYLEELTRLGVPIETHPAYGYRLTVPFDLVDREIIERELEARGLGWTVSAHVQTESTNDLAVRASEGEAADGSIFVAEYQSRGRGRQGRAWHSPVGAGLWFSVLRRHDLPIDAGWQVTLGAGLAVARAIETLTSLEPHLKWPNDVQIDGLKVAGILTESRSEANRLKHSVVGIGVNVHLDQREFPAELRDIACSIKSAGGTVTRTELLTEILLELERAAGLESAVLSREWSDRCILWGHRVRVENDNDTLEGKAIELSDTGALVIELENGKRHNVHAGDVVRLRAAD